MFILHSSNKTENLLTHLTSVIENMPLSNPLSEEVFLIQSQGMERWLSQQLASHFSLWANYEFIFPANFFSSYSKLIDDRINHQLFDRDVMIWHFEHQLRHCDEESFNRIKQYLEGDNNDLKRFQLAQQLAQIFDQYQIMRPEMLEKWAAGERLTSDDNEIWQQALWQKITQSIGNQHRGSQWQAITQRLNEADEGGYSNRLPERVFIFGLNTMPPIFLAYLQGLSRHCDLHLFLLNPVQVYWANWVSKKEIDIKEGHPLLATLGQQGREFQQLILEQVTFSFEPESFEEPPVTNNLQQLQNDILVNQLAENVTISGLEKDDSISIHACHSRMREVEVLKDQLLQCLEQDPSLELREIVVMTPDIQLYAPFITAVFNDIQHAIADKSMRLSNTLLDAFIRFLTLSQSRFGWQSVMELLEQPCIYTNFSLSETDLELINYWVSETHVRWGKSATHKKELGLPELNANTWQATLDRLLMGYAVESDNDFVEGILPFCDVEGSSAQALGGFNDYIQLLFKASAELKRANSLSQWASRLYYYVDQLLSAKTPTEQSERQQLNEVIELLIDHGQTFNDKFSLDVIIAWMERQTSERKSSTGFLRGQLTFCSMLPMRSIPFKVIALMGLNEGEFPKIDRPYTFDLLAKEFRMGDRSRRADDRYQFLEILLSAREKLIMTYKGLSIYNNDKIPPSVVMSELLDVLENYYQLTNMINYHPLQPFSPQYFNEEPPFFSYSKTHFETAVALSKNKKKTESWWQGTLENNATNIIELDDLFAFYRNPQRYFLQQKLGIRLTGLGEDVEEREPFTLNNLEAYQINQQWIEQTLKNHPFSLDKLQAEGRWLSGTYGTLEFDDQEQAIQEFTGLIDQLQLGEKQEDLPIDVKVGDYRLIGKLSNLYKKGSLFYRYANLKGHDFIYAWLHHLIINTGQEQQTYLISKDESSLFFSDNAERSSLLELIKIYHQGQQQPDAFFTESAFAFVKQTYKMSQSKRATKPAIDVALEKLESDMSYSPELRLLYQNSEDLALVLGDRFIAQCNDLILPAWKDFKNN